jgi:uncharacterized protein YqgV (UPF0045/DUF77 family)
MGTIVEGDLDNLLDLVLDNLLDLVKMMHRSVLDLPEIMRVVTTVKIDERQDKSASIAGKVAAVKKELAE